MAGSAPKTIVETPKEESLRRLVIIGTAVAVLVGATAAYAAFNSYTGSNVSFSPSGAGTTAKPEDGQHDEVLKASAPSGDRARPADRYQADGLRREDERGNFPTCTDTKIEADKTKFEKACPEGSASPQGPVHSLLGPGTDSSTPSRHGV